LGVWGVGGGGLLGWWIWVGLLWWVLGWGCGGGGGVWDGGVVAEVECNGFFWNDPAWAYDKMLSRTSSGAGENPSADRNSVAGAIRHNASNGRSG